MTTAKCIEYRIIRRLSSRERVAPVDMAPAVRWADRLIAVAGLTAGLFVLGACLEELLWAVIAGLTIFALGAGE